MPHIDNNIKLDFKDVLIRPKRSTIRSRADVSSELSCRFKYEYFKSYFTPFHNNPQENFWLYIINASCRDAPLILFCEDGVCIYRLPRLSGPNAAKLPVYILDRAEPEILRSKFIWKNVRPKWNLIGNFQIWSDIFLFHFDFVPLLLGKLSQYINNTLCQTPASILHWILCGRIACSLIWLTQSFKAVQWVFSNGILGNWTSLVVHTNTK